jgi:hypothetical protein
VPEEFRAVQWTRLAAGHTESAFTERVGSLLHGASAGGATQVIRPAAGGNAAAASKHTPLRSLKVTLVAATVAIILTGVAWWQLSRRSPASAPVGALTKSEQLVATARALYEQWDLATADDFKMADGLLKQATEMDPLNADAWASLAILSYGHRVFGFDASNSRLQLLRTSAERAIKLAPASDRAKFALALRYRQASNLGAEGARLLLELAERNPTDKFILRQVGHSLRA